jgi:hypothetical protein
MRNSAHRHTLSVQIRVVAFASLALLLSAKLAFGVEEWTYATQPGDNLWDLPKEYRSSMRNWCRLQRLNGVTRPRHIPRGTRTAQPRPTFEWSSGDPCGRYRLQLAGDAKFASPDATLSGLSKPRWSPRQPLPPGDYYWHISCADPAGGKRAVQPPPQGHDPAAPATVLGKGLPALYP